MDRIVIPLFIFTIFSCDSVHAEAFAYECEVLSSNQISEDGTLNSGYKIYKGRSFQVERSTGNIIGSGFNNASFETKTVLDPGNDVSSYKLISISYVVAGTPNSHNINYLEIMEWRETALKPFILINTGAVLTGVCR
jgi:hypothetical protein